MIRIKFVGDIMLGRFVAERYAAQPYQLLSEGVLKELSAADVRIANLESPVSTQETQDSLRFAAAAELLDQFKWVDCFSLSNNHINDFGTVGMTETLDALDSRGIVHNGLYTDRYKPYLTERNGERVAVITCADMMNYEFSDDCPYKTLRVNNEAEIDKCIRQYKESGHFVILYAHVGMLFTRFPNPVIRDFVHRMADAGADCVVTAHPHCLGGSERYNGKLIVYSLGDFLMDGASFRRRKAGILNLCIENGRLEQWGITPVRTSDTLVVELPDGKTKKRMLSDFESVSRRIERHSAGYTGFYKLQYKKELLAHSWSTLRFEYHRRGISGLFKTLSKRIGTVKNMTRRVFSDRSNMSYDADAVSENNTSINDIR